MELFERWAWYGMFAVLALYLTNSTDTGALGFSQAQKGYLIGTVVGLLYFLPTITGAIADKYGYKRILILSYVILAIGYYLMGQVNSYAGMWVVFLFVAIGAGLFKPVISATIAKTTTPTTSSIGFGIFYMIVNVGAFIGPIVASKFREINWEYVFDISAGVILINLILVIVFYREPLIEKKPESLRKSIATIFRNLYSVLRDTRFFIFLVIIVGFWTMYNQLFYTLPVFIEQWMDTSVIFDFLKSFSPRIANAIGTPEGTIAPEMLINIDAFYIVIFQVAVSALVMKYKPLGTMISGILVSSVGVGLWFISSNPFYLFITLLVFAVGEMMSSPKILEYIGRIAPKDKVAMYMGAYYLPMAGGNFFAGILSGDVYGNMSDKITLLQREVAHRGIYIPEISEGFSKTDYIDKACELMDMDHASLTTYLWESYQPYDIWMVFTGIGLGTVILLWLYDRFLLRKS
jgi:dipeptide/tripeptide permease